jgi:hypothetical protein
VEAVLGADPDAMLDLKDAPIVSAATPSVGGAESIPASLACVEEPFQRRVSSRQAFSLAE